MASKVSTPPYDPAAIGRIVPHVEIREVQLVHAHFEREDDGGTPAQHRSGLVPDIVFDVNAELSPGMAYFVARFGALVSESPSFQIHAFFRLMYTLTEDFVPDESDLRAFGNWNVVFNAWPYFREYVSSTVNRAGIPPIVLPVLRVPRSAT